MLGIEISKMDVLLSTTEVLDQSFVALGIVRSEGEVQRLATGPLVTMPLFSMASASADSQSASFETGRVFLACAGPMMMALLLSSVIQSSFNTVGRLGLCKAPAVTASLRAATHSASPVTASLSLLGLTGPTMVAFLLSSAIQSSFDTTL